jgi:hypothetical protein
MWKARAFPRAWSSSRCGRRPASDLVVTSQGPDRELKRQRFILADGTGDEWLAVQYEYRRRR